MRDAQSAIEPEEVKDYTFRSARGAMRLSDLFGDKECRHCTLWADAFNGVCDHLADRAAFVVASPDAPERQTEFAASWDWRFPMVSVEGTSFAQDMGYWRDGPLSGVSVFKRRGGKILRVADTSFSSGDDFCIVWHFLNLIPEGGGAWQPKYNYGT